MRTVWPETIGPSDRALVDAPSWGLLIDRWVPTTNCFIHLVSWMDPARERKDAHELVLLAAYRTKGDEATDFWDVLRTVILEYLSTRISSYVDWVVDRDESARDVVAALRRLPVDEQVLLCLHDEGGHTSRHEEGRFRAADLALLFGVEPSSIRTGRAASNDELDVVRAPVAVGVEPGPVAAHLPSDTRAGLPDPLGALDVDTSPVLQSTEPAEPAVRMRRWLAVAVAAAVVAIAVAPAVIAGIGDDGGNTSGGVVAVASLPAPAAASGAAEVDAVMWGPAPGVCPGDDTPCYMVDVHLTGHGPGRRLAVACKVADRPVPVATIVTADADGAATALAACAANRAARSLVVTVDGEPAATVDLPTTIVPSPTVTFTSERAAGDQPGCGAADCRFVDVTLSGFEPGAAITVSCVSGATGPFSPTVVTIGPDGAGSDTSCYFGLAGEQFWVEADGARSPTITWPEG